MSSCACRIRITQASGVVEKEEKEEEEEEDDDEEEEEDDDDEEEKDDDDDLTVHSGHFFTTQCMLPSDSEHTAASTSTG